MNASWRLDQLADVVARALETAAYDGQASGRVREVPDKRTIRYYTTLGLLDRPAEYRGRVAYYGRRHVLQLVAIKRLQAQGLSLVNVQRSLAGTDDRTLAATANLPDDFWDRLPAPEPEPAWQQPAADAPPPVRRAGAFWSQVSEPPARPAEARQEAAWEPQPAVCLPLGEGVTLVVEGVTPERIDPRMLTELAPAVESLLAALRRVGLTVRGPSPPDEDGSNRREC